MTTKSAAEDAARAWAGEARHITVKAEILDREAIAMRHVSFMCGARALLKVAKGLSIPPDAIRELNQWVNGQDE